MYTHTSCVWTSWLPQQLVSNSNLKCLHAIFPICLKTYMYVGQYYNDNIINDKYMIMMYIYLCWLI